MTTQGDGAYQVVRSPGFLNQWEDGLRSGRIPDGRQASLDRICSEVLARVPWIGAPRPGQPSNYRTVMIPRLTFRVPEIEIGSATVGVLVQYSP